MRKQGASLGAILRWAAQESELSATKAPQEPLLPIGTNLIIIKLIQYSYTGEPIYRLVKGGFPQFAYLSCLKGQDIVH